MSTMQLVEDTDNITLRKLGSGDALYRTFDPWELPGDVLLLAAKVHSGSFAETQWLLTDRLYADSQFASPYGVAGGLQNDAYLIAATQGETGTDYVPYVTANRGLPVELFVRNLSFVEDAVVRYKLYAVVTTLDPIELLPRTFERPYSLAGGPQTILAGETYEVVTWTRPGYNRLAVAGVCDVAWAIDIEWLSPNTLGVLTRWTETVAAGPAGELHADVPMRAAGARVKVRNTSSVAGTVAVVSRLSRR